MIQILYNSCTNFIKQNNDNKKLYYYKYGEANYG